MIKKLLLTTTLISLIAPAANAKVKVNEKKTYYTINAQNKKQLLNEMQKNKGRSSHGGITAATTSYNFTPKTSFQMSRSRCIAKSTDIILNITYHLPRIDNKKITDINFQRKWISLENHILQHELEHGKIAKQAAKKINTSLRSVNNAPTCKQLQKMQRQVIDKIGAEYAIKQRNLDKISRAEQQK